MTQSPLAAWHELVRTRSAAGLAALLAEDAVFYSPVVHTPQAGKALTLQYLTAAFQIFGDESFRYVRELADDRQAALEFAVEIDGVAVNGVDMMRWNEAGQIVEFKVLIRPLKAINLVHQKMAAMLSARP
jgi:hypothetical protein